MCAGGNIPYQLIDQFRHDKLGMYEAWYGQQFRDVKPDYPPPFSETAQERDGLMPPEPAWLGCPYSGHKPGIEEIAVDGQIDVFPEGTDDRIVPCVVI